MDRLLVQCIRQSRVSVMVEKVNSILKYEYADTEDMEVALICIPFLGGVQGTSKL